MNSTVKPTNPLRRRLRAGLMAVSVAAVLGGATVAPALADDDWHHDRFAREHWREHERWEHRHFAYVAPRYEAPYAAPGYSYYPGYAYSPAPAYVAPSFSVVVPLHIR